MFVDNITLIYHYKVAFVIYFIKNTPDKNLNLKQSSKSKE